MTVSLLPNTPDTMRDFKQEIVVDLGALTKASLSRKITSQLPEQGNTVSFVAAFEALRIFRELTREGSENYSDIERSHLAEIEVEWCLDLIGKLQDSGKTDPEQ